MLLENKLSKSEKNDQTKKFTITNHHELRKRSSIDLSEPKMTDQSFKKACDINNIIKTYSATGHLPHITSAVPKYQDNTTIPTLEASFDIVNQAYDQFYQLPPTIRKLMDNDPAKLESFISDTRNHNALIEHGVLISKPVEPTKELKPDNSSQV